MPSLRNPSIVLNAESAVRDWQSRQQRLTGRAPGIVTGIIAELKRRDWLRPAISFDAHEILSRGKNGLILLDKTRLDSPLLVHRLRHADYLIAGVCTLGEPVSAEIKRLFAQRQPLRAVLLDELGTHVLFQLQCQLEMMMRQRAADMGLKAGGVFSPGDEGFDLKEQTSILKLAKGDDIGVSLTEGSMLRPHKSLTFVMGWGERMPAASRIENCSRCAAKERCPYRKDATMETIQ